MMMVGNNSSRGNIPITVVVVVRGALCSSSSRRIFVAAGAAEAAGIETGCSGRHTAVIVAASSPPLDAAIDAAASAPSTSFIMSIRSRSSGLLFIANKLAKSSTRSITLGRRRRLLSGRRVLATAAAINIATSGRIIKFKTRSLIGKVKDQMIRSR